MSWWRSTKPLSEFVSLCDHWPLRGGQCCRHAGTNECDSRVKPRGNFGKHCAMQAADSSNTFTSAACFHQRSGTKESDEVFQAGPCTARRDVLCHERHLFQPKRAWSTLRGQKPKGETVSRLLPSEHWNLRTGALLFRPRQEFQSLGGNPWLPHGSQTPNCSSAEADATQTHFSFSENPASSHMVRRDGAPGATDKLARASVSVLQRPQRRFRLGALPEA